VSDPYDVILAQVDARLADGQPADAYRVLLGALAPQRPIPDEKFAAMIGALARIGEALGADALVSRVAAVVANPEDVDALFDLGWALIEQEAPAAALQVLSRADARAPGHPQILQELVTAYATLGMHASAVDALMAHPALLVDPMIAYLLAFNGVMAGGMQIARDQLGGLAALASDTDMGFLASSIVEMVARHDAVKPLSPLDAGDLRGWHLVTTGGLLLHTADSAHEGMSGRYAFVADSAELCLEGVRAVELVLRAWDQVPQRVWAFPDPRSQALAHAAAVLLGAEVGTWSPDVVSEPGLVVAYDLAHAPAALLQPLREKRPGQVLWQHAARWTSRQPIAPDLCTFVYQFLRDPWAAHEGLSEAGVQVRVVADDASPEERARTILACDLPEDAARGKASLLDLAMLPAGSSGAAGRRPDGWRVRFWGTSPVRSSRFV
jgi:hypothetical protein